MRPQAGVDRLKPGPPMHANDLPVVGQAPCFRLPTAFFLTFSRSGLGLGVHPVSGSRRTLYTKSSLAVRLPPRCSPPCGILEDVPRSEEHTSDSSHLGI